MCGLLLGTWQFAAVGSAKRSLVVVGAAVHLPDLLPVQGIVA